MSILWSILAGGIAGITGGMGLGGGTVLLIYLNLFTGNGQITSQGINLIFFIPVGLTAVIIYAVKKKISYKTLLLMLPPAIGGSLLGSYLLSFLNGDILQKAFAILLIVIGLKELFSKKRKNN